MDTKEQTQAANALIEWFNSQSLPPSDALAIMNKVVAKVIVANLPESSTASQRRELDTLLDTYVLDLVNAINARLFRNRR